MNQTKRSMGLSTNNRYQHKKLVCNPRTQGGREKGELETIYMKDIKQRIRMSEKSPSMTIPLVNHLNFDIMAKYGNSILLGTSEEIPDLDLYTKKIPTSSVHHKALPPIPIPTHIPG